MVDRNICRIDGEKVYLSILRDDDWAISKYVEWMSDEATNVLVEKNQTILDPSNMPSWVMDHSINRMGIVYKETDTLIGFCHIDHRADCHSAWLSINVGDKSMRGKGIGTEVMRMLCDFCLKEYGVASIHLDVLEANSAAIACYEKIGFKKSGVYRNHCFHEGKYSNWIHMDMLPEEFIRE